MTAERETDVFYKKVVTFTFSGQRLQFRVAQDLFSSHDVDVGTRFLLRTIVTSGHVGQPASILDLGCGYGPLGLTLKRFDSAALVHLTDRDALAVEYAAQNATLNGPARDVEIYGSLGYDDLRRSGFDLIVSNIPAKAGELVISDLLLGAGDHLAAGGLVAVVVVSPLEPLVERVLASRTDVDVVLHERRSGHVAFHYRFAGAPVVASSSPRNAVDRGVYRRGTAMLALPGETCSLQTAFGLPEFETPSYASALLIAALDDVRLPRIERALVFNPGQGHVPVALWNLLRPPVIDLVDRDLLALRYSALNLVEHGCPEAGVAQFHQVGIPAWPGRRAEVVAGVLRDEEGTRAHAALIARAAEQLSPEGLVVISGGSTAITRLVGVLEAEQRLEIVDRKRRHGQSVLVLSAARARR